MGHHLEYRNEHDRHHRDSSSDSLADAVRHALRVPTRPVLVLDAPGDPIQHGAGEVVATILSDGSVIEATTEPRWWSELGRDDQIALLADEGALTPDLVAAVARAGGAPIATYWNNQPSSSEGFLLSPAEEDWLRAERARREVQR